MVKIRLTRVGAKNDPKFRIVAATARSKRDGRPLEILGYYLPEEQKFEIDFDRYNFWIEKGAQPTEAVLKLLATNKIDKNVKSRS